MYTWGYIKNNALGKLNLTEDEAGQQGFLSRFAYYANEAMTQICSAVKPNHKYYDIIITKDNLGIPITLPSDFVAFSDDIVRHRVNIYSDWGEVGDDFVDYLGYNQIVCKEEGIYQIPYKARWFFFTNEITDETEMLIPADICDALPSYIVSQCFRSNDDERNATIYRNEYEAFIARMDDTNFKSQRTFHVGGGW